MKTILYSFIMIVLYSAGLLNGGIKLDNFFHNEGKSNSAEQYKYIGEPLKLGIVGFVHDHIAWILRRENFGDIEIVGIVEPNSGLVERYRKRYNFPKNIIYNTIEEMVENTKPEAVAAFNPIKDHLAVVEYCAPRGIHVMVEKPLATTVEDAEKMIELSKINGIHLITNYETTWYGSTYEAYKLVNDEQKVGDIRKIVFRTGHRGPVEIKCKPVFLEWLTDPIKNGGGALTDFGCYGANISTWFMKGETPLTVHCVTQQIKPHIYPKVDDEATIILTYPESQVIIQASWNWPFNRKDMDIYGVTGYVKCLDEKAMILKEDRKSGSKEFEAEALPNEIHDSFSFLTQIVKHDYQLQPFDLSSMENNMIVVQILEAAKHSAKTGKTVVWDEYYKK